MLYFGTTMPKELTAFRVASELMEAMRRVKDREGIPIAVQLDFALRAYLQKKDPTFARAAARAKGRR